MVHQVGTLIEQLHSVYIYPSGWCSNPDTLKLEIFLNH
jgi:hypothetical protein